MDIMGRKVEITNVTDTGAGNLNFKINIGSGNIECLFRLYNPQVGKSMELMDIIDYGDEEILENTPEEWDAIEKELREYSADTYLSLISTLTLENRYDEIMGMAGYEKIELPEDSMATVGYINTKTGEKVLSDGWEGLSDYLKTTDIQDEFIKGLVNRLTNEEKQAGYYITDITNAEMFYGELEEILERSYQISGNKMIGIYMEGKNGEREHMATATYFAQENCFLIPPESAIDFIASDFPEGNIREMYKKLSDKLYRENARLKVIYTLNVLKDMFQANIDVPFPFIEAMCYCRAANTSRPQDYVEIRTEGLEKTKEVSIEIRSVHANDVVYSSGLKKIGIELLVQKLNNSNFDWSKYFEDELEIKKVVEKLDTDYEYPLKLYSNDITKGAAALQDHFDELTINGYDKYPSEPLTFTGDLQEISDNMTEDEKEALIQGVEAAKDYNEPVTEEDSRLYDAVIKEKSSKEVYEVEIKEELSRIVKVKADSMEDAIRDVRESYAAGEIILGAEDFKESVIEPIARDNIRKLEKEPGHKENELKEQEKKRKMPMMAPRR